MPGLQTAAGDPVLEQSKCCALMAEGDAKLEEVFRLDLRVLMGLDWDHIGVILQSLKRLFDWTSWLSC